MWSCESSPPHHPAATMEINQRRLGLVAMGGAIETEPDDCALPLGLDVIDLLKFRLLDHCRRLRGRKIGSCGLNGQGAIVG
jgi:hypothetical protein